MPRSHAAQRDSRRSDDNDSHRQVDVDPLSALPIRMRAGDAVAFTRWTVHGSGANVTGEPRVAYALQYSRDDVKWLDPETRAVAPAGRPAEVVAHTRPAARLTEPAQRDQSCGTARPAALGTDVVRSTPARCMNSYPSCDRRTRSLDSATVVDSRWLPAGYTSGALRRPNLR